jgi:hypothetical protein
MSSLCPKGSFHIFIEGQIMNTKFFSCVSRRFLVKAFLVLSLISVSNSQAIRQGGCCQPDTVVTVQVIKTATAIVGLVYSWCFFR